MKHYIKRAIDTLVALDCRLDHTDRELRTDRWRFTHPNTPGEFFTINYRSSETACRAVVQRAKIAAGLATTESTEATKPKANQRAKAERAAERKRRETARLLAEAKHAERVAAQESARIATRRRELDRLMRGTDAATPAAVRADAMLTVAQVADQTGLTDKAVLRAIESGRLEAYRCGKDIKVKGADVRDWLVPS